jgi:hypothetical protein
MQKQTSLYIPTPCHEDWNKMTPTQQGKFCASCNKQVVDFSLMSDNQILNFLSHQSGKLCGRFDAEQLQRPLVETKIKKKKSWWMALTMPLLFLFDRSDAQKFASKQKHRIVQSIDTSFTTVGAVAVIVNERIITGKVVDENNNPLAYASVIQKGFIGGTTTDSLGNFSIKVNSYDDSIILIASYVGYSSIEKNILLQSNNVSDVIIKLPEYVSKGLVDVVVISESLRGTVGGLIICRKVTTFEKINTAVHKVLNISAFKVYPNPAIKGSTIHLEINQAGEYQLYLLDDRSGLIKAEEINIYSKKSVASITIPSNIAAGIYYVRLIDEQKKKSYTEKIIIQ